MISPELWYLVAGICIATLDSFALTHNGHWPNTRALMVAFLFSRILMALAWPFFLCQWLYVFVTAFVDRLREKRS